MDQKNPVDVLNGLKSRLDKVRMEASTLTGRVATLKEQYAKKAEGLARFGCKTVEELDAKVRVMDAELAGQVNQLEKALSMHERGQYAEVIGPVGGAP